MMKKTIIINGMTNRFSASKVKEAIESIPGVSATVFLAEKKAVAQSNDFLDPNELVSVILYAGYEVSEIL